MALNSLIAGIVRNVQIEAKYCSPMRKEHPTANQRVGLMPGHFFKPLQQRIINPFRTELDDKLIVVNCGLFAILGHGALHVPGCYDLLVGSNL